VELFHYSLIFDSIGNALSEIMLVVGVIMLE